MKEYYRSKVTIPMLDELCMGLRDRFCVGLDVVMKGVMLLPSSTLEECCLDLYRDQVPSYRDLLAELTLWQQKWNDTLDIKLKSIQEQYVKATVNPSVNERKKLKKGAVPSTILSTLDAISNLESNTNVHYLLTVLAVMPLTTCEAERNISCLRRLKTCMRSTKTD